MENTSLNDTQNICITLAKLRGMNKGIKNHLPLISPKTKVF